MENNLYNTAATLFGGYSQVSDRILGVALAGHINNGLLREASIQEIEAEIDVLVNAVYDRWFDPYDDRFVPDPVVVRRDIIAGMIEELRQLATRWETPMPLWWETIIAHFSTDPVATSDIKKEVAHAS